MQAGGFGTAHSCSPEGKAWHLDVRDGHPHDHQVLVASARFTEQCSWDSFFP